MFILQNEDTSISNSIIPATNNQLRVQGQSIIDGVIPVDNNRQSCIELLVDN